VSTVVGVTMMGVLAFSALAIRKPAGEAYALSDTYRLGVRLPDDAAKRDAIRETPLVKYAPKKNLSSTAEDASLTNVLGQGLLGKPVGPAHEERPGGARKPVRAHYLFPFEIVSVHLLVVLIGAAYLARAKRRRTQSPLVAGGPEGGPAA
jgi:hypothetical protein